VLARDETSWFVNAAVANAEVRWTIPGDWTSQTYNITSDSTGVTTAFTGYLHRMIPSNSVTSAVKIIGNSVINYVKLGSANASGLPFNPGTLDYITYDIHGRTFTTPVVLGFVNATTGRMSTTTIAANRQSSFSDTGHKLDVPDLAFNNDDEFMLWHLSGGNLTDLELRLYTA